MLKHVYSGHATPELPSRHNRHEFLYVCYRLPKLMAPSRKSRSVNKRFSSANETSSSKYVEDANKSKQKVCVFVVKDDLSKIYLVCRLSICLYMKKNGVSLFQNLSYYFGPVSYYLEVNCTVPV